MEDKVLTGMNVCQYVLVGIQADTIFRWIQLGLAILCTLVGLAYRIWCWYRNAKKDGKITGDEIKQLIDENKDDVSKVVDDVTELVDDIKENKNS